MRERGKKKETYRLQVRLDTLRPVTAMGQQTHKRLVTYQNVNRYKNHLQRP